MPIWTLIPWQSIKSSKLVRNTVSMLSGGAITMALQAAYFVMIARSLGPGQYGAFAGVLALIAALSPFSVLGVGTVLVKNVSRDRERFRESLGNAILATVGLSAILLIVLIFLSPLIFSAKVPLALVLLVGVSDLIFGGIVSLAGLAFQAFEMLGKTAQLTATLSAVRVIAALVMFTSFSRPNALSWAVLYLGSSIIGAAIAASVVFRTLGAPRLALSRLRSEVVEGFSFSIGACSAALYNNIDKPLLVRLGTLNTAGLYGIAYRVIDLAFQPIGALQASAFSKFFQHGSEGIAASARYGRRLLPICAGYGLIAGSALFLAAPVFPYIVGRQFAGSVEVLRWLSPLILFRAAHYCYSNALTGADFQGLRSCIQVIVAVLNVILNVWLIPIYSWKAAAWASLVSDGLLALGTWAAILALRGRSISHAQAALQPGSSS